MFELKDLVQSLFANREAEEGVRDLKSATQMVEQLPENQVLEAVTEIVKALQKLNRNQRVGVKERFRTIAYLDEKTRPLLDHLIDVFFGRKVDTTAAPRQVLLAIVSFLGEMANAYGVCLKVLSQSFRGIDAVQLQRFTLRGMLYCSALTKWSYTRYLPVKQGVWHILNQFYQFAEQQHFTQITLQPYADQPMTTSVLREYLQCLMLSLAMPEKMQVGQIELVSCWLRKWGNLPELEDTIRPHHQSFAINTTASASPRRLQRDMVGDGWRYIQTENMAHHMQSVLSQLQHGDDPVSLGLPAESAQPINIQLMQQLLRLWSHDFPPPGRRDKRQRVNRPLVVIRGFAALVEQLASGQAAIKAPRGMVLQFTVENESPSGVGAKFIPQRAEQLPVGEVVGLLNEDGSLRIGVVRWIACQPDSTIFASIEFLGKQVILVDLTLAGAKQSIKAIYSPDSAPNNKDRFLLLPQEHHVDQADCLVAAQGKSFPVRLSPVLEYTQDTVRVGFFVQGKTQG